MLVSEQARVFQVRGLRCSKELTVLGLSPVRLGMQIANVKHSRCEAKLGFRVWETKFGCVHRKTEPTGPGGPLN